MSVAASCESVVHAAIRKYNFSTKISLYTKLVMHHKPGWREKRRDTMINFSSSVEVIG